MITNIFAVFIGGGIGAVLRYLTTVLCRNTFSLSSLGTFLVNIIGCFFIGYVFALTLNKAEAFSQVSKLFITVGLLGGLTTFSTFNLEVFELMKNGKLTAGLLYMLGSCVIGLSFTFLGYYISKL